MRLPPAVAALVLAPLLAVAAQPAAPAPAELRPLMLERGEALLAEDFADEGWTTRWGKRGSGWQAGAWTLVDGAIESRELPEEKHHVALPHRVALTDLVVQFRFQFVDCDMVFIGFSEKEHVARLFIRRDSIEIARMTGIGATTKSERIDRAPARFEPGAWHTAVIELSGDAMLAQVDERWFAYGEMAGVGAAKNRVELMAIGKTGAARFDDVRIWRPAGAVSNWETQRKPKLLAAFAKRTAEGLR